MDFNTLVGSSIKVDPEKNPFLKLKNGALNKNCDSISNLSDHFNCVVRNFIRCQLPIELGPVPDPDFKNLNRITDSIFIVDCIGDKNYFKIPLGDRTYSYQNGCLIKTTDDYFLCIIPYVDCCSINYDLYSFSKSGVIINTIKVGGITSDISETYSFFRKPNKFIVLTNEFIFKDQKASVSKSTRTRYKISNQGLIKN